MAKQIKTYRVREDWCACDNNFYCVFKNPDNEKLTGNAFHGGNNLNGVVRRCRLKPKGENRIVCLLNTGIKRIEVVAYKFNDKPIGKFLVSEEFPPELIEHRGAIYRYQPPSGPILFACYVFIAKPFKTDDLKPL